MTPCCFPFVDSAVFRGANVRGDSLAGAPSIAVFQAYMRVACFLCLELVTSLGFAAELWGNVIFSTLVSSPHRMPRMKSTRTSEFSVCSDSHKLFTGVSWSYAFQIISLLKERLISPRIEFKEDFSIKKKNK